MKRFTAIVYVSGSSGNYFNVVIEAQDYWDAQRRIEAQYAGRHYSYLTEA